MTQEIVSTIDTELIEDAGRFRWLMNQGFAWRRCYNSVWKEGEWLYGFQNAREQIDLARKQ